SAQTFTVTAPPVPTLTSLSPNSGNQGSAVPVTLTGANFISGATIAVSDPGVTVSNVVVVNSTWITAPLTIANNPNLAGDNVTVTTSGGISGPQVFTVNAPSVTSATFTFNIPMNGGVSLVTSDPGTTTTVLHAQASSATQSSAAVGSSKLAAPATS